MPSGYVDSGELTPPVPIGTRVLDELEELDESEELTPVPRGTDRKVDPVPTGPRRLVEVAEAPDELALDELTPVPRGILEELEVSGVEELETTLAVVEFTESFDATSLGGRTEGGMSSGTPLGSR